jgi:hypothetical protein
MAIHDMAMLGTVLRDVTLGHVYTFNTGIAHIRA